MNLTIWNLLGDNLFHYVKNVLGHLSKWHLAQVEHEFQVVL